ncbi:MAG: GDYXXLXY domain-containing protein [Myxococcota bacterium]|nr:GDYXXLXY domain-containing protein [Myxococcota bacterium]
MRTWLIFAGLALSLGVPFGLVAQKERVRATGTRVLLPLAPVDPRSLIQGDYMILAYALVRELPDFREWPRDGELVVRVDADAVASFARRNDGQPLQPGEQLLRYRIRANGLRLGAEAFHFQEGKAGYFQRARFGELRVTSSGDSQLVGLSDEQRQPLDH